jgi:indolepyruvate ferredoxin oxidoreductase beta subunit
MPVTESLMSSGYNGDVMTGYLEKNTRCIFVDGALECEDLGSSKFLNILLLGAAAGSGALGIDKEVLLDEIRARVPKKYTDINIQAFLRGYYLGAGQV